MKPTFRSFLTFSATALFGLGANTFHLYCIGLDSRLTLRWCWMTSLSILCISSCFQVKTSWFFLRKVVIFIFFTAESPDPIFNTLDGSLGTISTSHGTSDNLGSVQVHLSSMYDFPLMLGGLMAFPCEDLVSSDFPYVMGNGEVNGRSLSLLSFIC